jgi:hypothetical protein
MGEAIILVIFITLLGLLIAFNPSLIFINFFLAIKSPRPLRDTLILVAGATLPLILTVLAIIYWLEPDSVIDLRGLTTRVRIPPLVDILFGLSLLILAFRRRYRTKHHHSDAASGFYKRAQKIMTSPWSIFSFSFLRSSLSLTHLLAIVVLAKTVVVHNLSAVGGLISVVWVIGLGIAPLLAAPYLCRYRPQSLERTQTTIDNLLNRDLNTIITLLLALGGVGFFLHGTWQMNGGR